jgi:hypothetical protein
MQNKQNILKTFNLEYVYLVENRRMEDQNKVNIKEAVNE